MPIFSRAAGVPEPVIVDGVTYIKSDWMQTVAAADLSPTVFLVEQPPNVSLRTHFHRQNQFQLFVRGDGTIGRHRLQALMVHYAGAYSAYGPLMSGPRGLAYFTLRTVFEKGSLTMTHNPETMQRGPKRQLHSAPVTLPDAASLAGRTAIEVDDLIAPQADGSAATLYTLPPNTRVGGTEPAGSAGQFYVVVSGHLIAGEALRRTWESIFVAPGESGFEMIAGDEGAQVVCLQLPPRAGEYRI